MSVKDGALLGDQHSKDLFPHLEPGPLRRPDEAAEAKQ